MIDFKKFEKYSLPGPRYTSYPTAVEFTEEFTKNDLINIYKTQNNKNDLSLYIHIPFCRQACYFCGCNVIFTSKDEKKTKYIKYLIKELNILKKYIDTNRNIVQMHFGGGTPTYLDENELDTVIYNIKKVFPNFDKNAEISCEVDPRYFTQGHMNVLKKYGCNRLSFGVQDLDEKVQKEIHRIQPYEITENVVKIARNAGIKSINIDLIYGLPLQTKDTFEKTVKEVIKLNPDRLEVFNYAHVPWIKKTMRKFDENTFCSPSQKLDMFKNTIKILTQNSYKMIGIDHFAKSDDELFKAIKKGELHRNFQGYSTKSGSDLIGIGVTSIGNGENYYVQNQKDLKKYEESLDIGNLAVYKGYKLNEDDKIRQFVIMELMSNFWICIKKVEDKFGIIFKDYFKEDLKRLDSFIKEELLLLDDNKIEAINTGKMLIRNIAMVFDIYLHKQPIEKRKFSKTI